MLVPQPEATLVAITEEARRALDGADEMRVVQGFLSSLSGVNVAGRWTTNDFRLTYDNGASVRRRS